MNRQSVPRLKKRIRVVMLLTGLMAGGLPMIQGRAASRIGEGNGAQATSANKLGQVARPAGSLSGGLDSKGQAMALGAVNRAAAVIKAKIARWDLNQDLVSALNQELLNLETTKQILTLSSSSGLKTLGDKLAVARVASVRQALGLGIRLPQQPPAPSKSISPSRAAFELIKSFDITPTAQQTDKILELDRLPPPLKNTLGAYIDAFLRFQESTKASFANINQAKATELENQLKQFLASQKTPASSPGAPPEFATGNPAETMKSLGIAHLHQLLSARLSLLNASGELAVALKANPAKSPVPTKPSVSPPSSLPFPLAPGPAEPSNPVAPPAQLSDQLPGPGGIAPNPLSEQETKPGLPLSPPAGPLPLRLSSVDVANPPTGQSSANPKMDECSISVPLALCVDLGLNTNNTYRLDYALQIDAGGDDIYLNNSGGDGHAVDGATSGAKTLNGLCSGSAALLDVSGDDQYRSPYLCGGNGGGYFGVGFLADLGGDDLYEAGVKARQLAQGMNGGAALGLGFLFDAGGDDSYIIKGGGPDLTGTNGGGSGGAGFLLDVAGNDVYEVGDLLPRGNCPTRGQPGYIDCQTRGANGGGSLGSGFLLDLAGNDAYKAAASGINGGASLGTGVLMDGAGDDEYQGADYSANGGSEEGSSFLFDAGGNDSYLAGRDGTNGGSILGTGLLLDAAGLDFYQDHSSLTVDGIPSGTGRDRSVLPKGPAGAQIDENSPSADLGVAISDSPDPVPAGQNLSYSINVQNNGPSSRASQKGSTAVCDDGTATNICNPPAVDAGLDIAADVTLTDDLPPGANFTSATPSRGSCAKSGATLTCHLGDLANASSAQVTVVVTPHNPPGTVISSKVSVTSATPDPNETNNSATAETTVGQGAAVLSVSIADAPPVTEGGQATQTISTFKVALSAPSELAVKVDFATADGTATASGKDYQQATGALTFAPGQTAKTVSVPVAGDNLSEADETFFVNLSNPTNAIVDNGQGAATILDDDALPAVSIVGEAVKEGDTGGANYAEFTVSISPASGQTVSVDYATIDGSATVADDDYRAASGTLTFAPGQQTRTLKVTVVGDAKPENDENFFANLSNPQHLLIGNGQGQGIILNDDTKTIFISQYVPIREGDSGTTDAVIEVSLSAEAANVVTVDYSTVDGTATAPSDYQPASGTLTFEPGQKTKLLSTNINGDTQIEPSENFFLKLSNPQNASFREVSLQGGASPDELVARGRASPGQLQGPARFKAPAGLLAGSEVYKEVYDTAEIVIRNDDTDSIKKAGGGGVFVTQHVADDVASGIPDSGLPNTRGAQHIVQQAIDYVTDGRPDIRILLVAGREGPAGPLRSPLFVPGEPTPGSYEITGMAERGIRSVGFEACPGQGPRGCFVVADHLGTPERLDLGKVDFKEYDAVVVSSYNNFRQGDLDILNRRSNDLIDAVHHGTGLVAFEEYFESYPLDAFGFLPCLRPAFDEVADTLDTYKPTPFGHSLGLTDADFEKQSTENFFVSPACGLEPVNLNAFGFPVTLAGHLDPIPDPAQQSLVPTLPAGAAGALPPQTPKPPEKGPSLPRQDAPPPLPPRSLPAEQVQGTPVVNQAQQQSQQQVQEQMQAQMHQLAQANNAQAQPAVHIQGAVTREKQKAPAVTLARVEERAPQPTQASARQGEYLASARQTALPAGASIGAVALMAGLLGLSRPRKMRARRVTVLHIKSGPIHKTSPTPRHRGR